MLIFLYALIIQIEWDINLDLLASIPEETSTVQSNLQSGRLRFNFESSMGQNGSWGFAYEQVMLHQKNLFWTGFNNQQLRYDDWNPDIKTNGDGTWSHQLDRAYIQNQWGNLNLKVGRQAIGHGNGRFFNPSDIYSPLSPFSISTEYKRGIDAVLMSYTFLENWELQALYVFNRPGEDMRILRASTQLMNLDISSYIGESYGEFTWGWDMTWTFWGSAGYTEGLTRTGQDRDDPWRIMIGFQRQLTSKANLIVEHLFDSLGLSSFSGLDLYMPPKEVFLGEQFFLGKNHSALFLDFELDPLWHAGLQIIFDHAGPSNWLVLSLDWDIRAYAQVRSGILLPSGPELSDFGTLSNTFYVECKWFF